MATIEQVLVIKIHCPPCPREGQENYILKIYPPGGCEIKKEGGCFLGTSWRKFVDTLIGGGGLSVPRRVDRRKVRVKF